MTAIGLTPSGTVVAENVRDNGAGRDTSAVCYFGGSSFLLFLTSRSSGLTTLEISSVATRV